MKKSYRLVCLLMTMIAMSCNDRVPAPKPRAYPRVEYPERKYNEFDVAGCPFQFEFPAYAEVQMKKDRACWFDLFMPAFKARLHCSYVAVNNRAEFDELVRDAYTIAKKINARANYMEESVILNKQNIPGLTLHWTGPAASPMHFFLTDTMQHFFKAALYFEAEVQPDSLAPIVQFIEDDIDRLIQSFDWKQN